MDSLPALRTFADLARRGERIDVTCQRCGAMRIVDGSGNDRRGRPLGDQPVAGRRYVCACGGVGLPTIRRKWVEALSRHGRAQAARQVRS